MKKILIIPLTIIHLGALSQPVSTSIYPVAVAVASSTWNQVLSNASWTYSGTNNITKNSNSANPSSGILTNSFSGNQIVGYYCDPSNAGRLEGFGLCTTSFNKNGYTGGSSTSYGLLSLGNGFYLNTASQSMTNQPNYASGDTVWLIRNTANQIWYAKYSSGTHHYAFSGTSSVPSTGVGGFTVAAGTYYPQGGDFSSVISTIILGSSVPALLISDCNASGSTYVYIAFL